jgi:hypothetical protein
MNLSFRVFAIIIIFIGCKKTSEIKYTVSGQLLESSSNPIPVKNIKLYATQKDDYALLGGVAGLRIYFEADVNGAFSLSYVPLKGTGLSSGTPNGYPLSIQSIDTGTYKYSDLYLYPITANKDTNLNTIFLYKKIEKFVRKIQFNAALNATDSFQIITSTAFRSIYKTIYGPISSGTLLVVDTINQYRAGNFNLTTQKYYSTSALKKPSYQRDFSLMLAPGDEPYREHLLIYP